MDLKTAREYYDLGVLTGFDIVRAPMSASLWLLQINGKDGRAWLLKVSNPANRGVDKVYTTLDSALAEIERITGRATSLHVSI
jgi:hypothetical protein